MLAHLCSLALTALLCVPLLGRYYRLGLLVRAPIPAALARNLLLSGLGLLPANLARRLLIDAPPVILNLTIPGARGAAAAGLFEIARKLSTVPYIVRQAFQYVLGPLVLGAGACRPPAGRAALPFRQPGLDRARRAALRPARLRRRRHPLRLPAGGDGGSADALGAGRGARHRGDRRARPRPSSR